LNNPLFLKAHKQRTAAWVRPRMKNIIRGIGEAHSSGLKIALGTDGGSLSTTRLVHYIHLFFQGLCLILVINQWITIFKYELGSRYLQTYIYSLPSNDFGG